MELKKISKLLEKELDQKRFEHTKGVEYTAATLAFVHGMDPDKALYAGLLHDCAKGLSDEKKISLCEKNGIEITEVERANPGLLHAKLGAFLAETKYEITDENILNAIRFHTTGRPDMSLLEKIIFVADYIEPNRFKLPGLDIIRKMSYTDLDGAICLILDNTLKYLGEGTKAVDPMTRQTYEFYKKQ
jgi:predicted HD superfamily hydrolase involved in NAD metabolism